MPETVEKRDVRDLHWWQRPKWLAALAAFIASVSLAAFAATTVVNESHLQEVSDLAQSNAAAIEKLERQQAGIDELVAFVRDLQERPDIAQTDPQVFIDLLCASSDRVRVAACAELQGAPP